MINFLPSLFIYPVEKSILLSIPDGITLGNLHNEEEIDSFSKYLSKSFESLNYHSNVLSIGEIVHSIKGYYNREGVTFSSDADDLKFLAKNWLVCRFNYDELDRKYAMFQVVRANGKSEKARKIYDERDSYIVNFNKLTLLSNFIGFILPKRSNGKIPRSILLHENSNYLNNTQSQSFNYNLMKVLIAHIHYTLPELNIEELVEKGEWEFYPLVQRDLNRFCSKIDELTKLQERKVRIGYILNQLKLYTDNSIDHRIRIVLLAGIVEVLLIDPPDYSPSTNKESINK